MSTFTGESSGPTNNDNFVLANAFFEEAEAPPPAPPKITNLPTIFSSKCASWVRDQSFEIQPTEETQKSVEFQGSPLPESVGSWSGFLTRNAEKKRKNPRNSEENEKERRKRRSDSPSTVPPLAPQTFFEKFDEKLAEAQKSIEENPENWTKIHGIYVEKLKDFEEEESDDGPKSKFSEIMALFDSDNSNIYYTMEFDNGYKFNWDLFDKESHQFVVFTKVCQSHPPEEFVEMRKEDTKCTECSSTNLAITVRLTVPLDLSDVPIPIFEDVQIYVSFRTAHLLDKSGIDSMELMEKSCDFSKKNCRKMWLLYQKMVEERKNSWEYKKWFDGCKEFVKTTLASKTLHLLHGRVIRRKIEESSVDSKKRCLIFGDLFELDD